MNDRPATYGLTKRFRNGGSCRVLQPQAGYFLASLLQKENNGYESRVTVAVNGSCVLDSWKRRSTAKIKSRSKSV